MKIAVACEQNAVATHFGYCEKFFIFQEREKEIVHRAQIENPGHRPGFLPQFLHDLGVDVIITGGMGGKAIELFTQHKIAVVTNAQGCPEEAARQYLQGDLPLSSEPCR